jgi:Zn-dependent protease
MRMFRAGTIRNHPILVHWSVPLVACGVIAFNYAAPVTALVSVISYCIILVVHELGHATVARRRRCSVTTIEIYPLHGLCRFYPNIADDVPMVAWGGVLAQLLSAACIMGLAEVLAYTQVPSLAPLNAIFGILGPANVGIALLNLLPIPRFDGAVAWKVVSLFARRFGRRRRSSVDLTAMQGMEEALKKHAEKSRGTTAN